MHDESSTPRRSLEESVALARMGDRDALEEVVHSIQPDIHRLAIRFLWHPQDAEDATHEILIRVITNLSGFRGESAFRTWVYRVATNALLTSAKKRMEQRAMSFEEFAEDLSRGRSTEPLQLEPGQEEALLLEEVKIGCTHAMLLCLDRDHRMAYILGEIMELDHNEAAEVLEVAPATYRKRLSRARSSITSFMMSQCGLANPANECRCRSRVKSAIGMGRVDPDGLQFATSLQRAKEFPEVVAKIRMLEEARRAAALFRSHPDTASSENLIESIRRMIQIDEGAPTN